MYLPSVQRIKTTVSTGNQQVPVNDNLISLPLYAVEILPAMLDTIRADGE